MNVVHITPLSIKLVMYQKSGRILTETPLITALMAGVESEGRVHKLDTIIYTIKEDENDFHSKINSLLKERNSGIILLATELGWDDVKIFAEVTVPLVVVDAWFKEGYFDTVLMNNTDSLYTTVSCLVDNGHEKIGYLGSTITIRNFYYREIGFKRAMADFGLVTDERYNVKLDPTMNGAYEDMKRYLAQNHSELPTAYCAVNDIVAFGAMKALKECGYRIPEDISIIGFDNMPFCDITSPTLTTIDVFKKEMGEAAVKRLVAQCRDKCHVPAKTQLHTKLVFRDSVKNIKI